MSVEPPPTRLERITTVIEKHPAKIIAGVGLTAVGGAAAFFLLGFNYRKDIQEAALLDLVPRGSYVLKSDTPGMLTDQQIRERYIERAVVERDYVLRSPPSPGTSGVAKESWPTEPQSTDLRFTFSNRRPFPAGYDVVTPGMRFSDATRVFPNGKLTQGAYQIRLSEGLFTSILFLPRSQSDADPVISVVAFHISDRGPDVVKLALREFGSLPHRNEVLGSRVVWPDVGGFEVAVATDSYMVSLRD